MAEKTKKEVKASKEKTYKVVFDRNACIGAAACAAVAPQFWVMKDDGKADLVGHKMEDGKQVLVIKESQVTDGMKKAWQLNKEAAEVCPVQAIHVFDDKGEKIV